MYVPCWWGESSPSAVNQSVAGGTGAGKSRWGNSPGIIGARPVSAMRTRAFDDACEVGPIICAQEMHGPAQFTAGRADIGSEALIAPGIGLRRGTSWSCAHHLYLNEFFHCTGATTPSA